MSTPDHGGPAFPIPRIVSADGRIEQFEDAGMTLRDRFAIAALQGHVAKRGLPYLVEEDGIANGCYRIADAMLKAREGKE